MFYEINYEIYNNIHYYYESYNKVHVMNYRMSKHSINIKIENDLWYG
jgi:hypothetical protein